MNISIIFKITFLVFVINGCCIKYKYKEYSSPKEINISNTTNYDSYILKKGDCGCLLQNNYLIRDVRNAFKISEKSYQYYISYNVNSGVSGFLIGIGIGLEISSIISFMPGLFYSIEMGIIISSMGIVSIGIGIPLLIIAYNDLDKAIYEHNNYIKEEMIKVKVSNLDTKMLEWKLINIKI